MPLFLVLLNLLNARLSGYWSLTVLQAQMFSSSTVHFYLLQYLLFVMFLLCYFMSPSPTKFLSHLKLNILRNPVYSKYKYPDSILLNLHNTYLKLKKYCDFHIHILVHISTCVCGDGREKRKQRERERGKETMREAIRENERKLSEMHCWSRCIFLKKTTFWSYII